MKTAHHPDTHQSITAAADAPPQAICPDCGGPVTLRCRQRMNGTAVYFWRHLDNQSQACGSRTHVKKKKKREPDGFPPDPLPGA